MLRVTKFQFFLSLPLSLTLSLTLALALTATLSHSLPHSHSLAYSFSGSLSLVLVVVEGGTALGSIAPHAAREWAVHIECLQRRFGHPITLLTGVADPCGHLLQVNYNSLK